MKAFPEGGRKAQRDEHWTPRRCEMWALVSLLRPLNCPTLATSAVRVGQQSVSFPCRAGRRTNPGLTKSPKLCSPWSG